MSIVRQEQAEHELAIFMMRNEGGVQAVRAWLYARRDQINQDWPGQDGEYLPRLQGEARAIAKLIRLIDIGPTLKPIGGQ
jgi:hypothetical protein